MRDGDTTLPVRASIAPGECGQGERLQNQDPEMNRKILLLDTPTALPRAPSRVCVPLNTPGSDLKPQCQCSPESAGEPRTAGKKLALSIGYIFKFEIFKYYEAEI